MISQKFRETSFYRRWRELYWKRVGGSPSDKIVRKLEAEADAKEYEPAETDWDKVPTREEMKEILDEKWDRDALSFEDIWPLEMDGKVKRDRARKKT